MLATIPAALLSAPPPLTHREAVLHRPMAAAVVAIDDRARRHPSSVGSTLKPLPATVDDHETAVLVGPIDPHVDAPDLPSTHAAALNYGIGMAIGDHDVQQATEAPDEALDRRHPTRHPSHHGTARDNRGNQGVTPLLLAAILSGIADLGLAVCLLRLQRLLQQAFPDGGDRRKALSIVKAAFLANILIGGAALLLFACN